MARSPKEAIAIIIDIGGSITPGKTDVKPGFLDKALQCVSMIIKRKIFSMSKDEIAIVLMGTEDTKNNLDYDHITVPYSLELPSWEMLQFLEKELKGTSETADWLDAVVVSMDLLKKQSQAKQFTEKKIVLFTDLKSPVMDDKLDMIISNMKKEEYTFIVIGPDTSIKTEEDMDVDEKPHFAIGTDTSKTKIQLASEALLNKILNETGGVICNFGDAVPQLMYFQKKVIRSMPWNIVMDIGPDIRIPVSGYKKISPAKLPTWKTTSSLEKGVRVESETTYTRQDENMTAVESEDVIPGYSYGTTLVPMSDVDMDSMSYKSGSKCLSVLGFTKSKYVSRHLLVGEGVMYFFPQKNDENAAVALSSLINAMKEQDLYAIVRKVYRDNLAPRLGVLLPKITSSYECLVFVELPYSEDMREFIFPPVMTDKNKPSQEQLDAIDSLIDNMDLTCVKNEFDETTEAFQSKSILNPYHQHVYHSLAFRALNPDAELPAVRDDVLNLLKSPFEEKASYRFAVQKINDLFQLSEVVQKSRPKAAADLFKVDENAVKDEPMEEGADLANVTMASLIQSKIIEVGSVKPVEDFKVLIEEGQRFGEVCSQMQKVIINLVIRSFGTDSFDKAEWALRELRSACADKDPSLYNDWIPKFRENLFERGKTAFWGKIVESKLGLISSHESVKSSVTEADSMKFLDYEEPKEVEAPVEEEFDEDDLLNEM